MAQAITDNDFDDVISSSDKPVLVDFWAPWCGPCQMLGPIIDEIAEEAGEKADVRKLNVDENPQIAGRYGVMSIPTVMLIVNGEVKETFVGVRGKEDYLAAIDKFQ